MAGEERFRPTLLVGVGGTGCDIVERVHRRAMDGEMGRQGRIGILGLDTDANDMRRMRGVKQRSQIRFSTPDTVYQLLDKNPRLEEGWFGPRGRLSQDILNMNLVDGAAQIRLLTRLAFHHTVARGGIERQLGDALATLARHGVRDAFEGVVNVMLVGSLAGATGSGSFLQVALLLAALGRERNVPVDVRGLFLLPDIFVRGASIPREQVPNVLANAYAALKELNAVNNKTGRRGDQTPFVFEYAPGRHITEGGQPFRSLALIDFETTLGGSYGQNFEAYKAMAARAAYQLIFSPIGQKTASVAVNDARSRLAAAADGTHNLYAGLGVSAIDYPSREVAEYLTLRLAQENLGGDWLRIDRAYFDRVRRYEDQRRDGNLSVQPPDQGRSFLEDLDTLALKDRIVFFTEIRSRLYPEIRREPDGLPEVLPRHLAFLEALQRELRDRFWSTDRIAEIRQRPQLDVSQLRNLTALTDIVRRLEFQLDDDLAALDIALRTLPEDLFRAVLLIGDDFSEAEWRGHHLQTYIIKGGPHLVEVRAFLYALQQAIAAEKKRLDPAASRNRVMRAASVFDDSRGNNPTDRRSPKTLEAARKAAAGGWLDKLRKRAEQFAEEYVSYYNGSLNNLRSYGEQGLQLTVLELLEDEVVELGRALSGLFVELGAVFARLSVQVATEENRHNPEAGLIDGNVPVYADAAAKRALWNDLSRRASGLRLGEDANRKLAAAVYRRYREDRRNRKPTDIPQLGELFTHAIVDDFARVEVESSLRGAYDFSIIEAVKRQAAVRDEDWRALLRRQVDLVSTQSEPFLSLTDQNDGQRVIFWAVHPVVKAEINDDATYNGLFTFQQGEAPLEGPEFSQQALLCMNSRVNLELRHLAKLRPADSGPANVNRPAEGNYARAYARMIDGLMEAELTSSRAREFTPHLDANWHRPGALPEIFPELSAGIRHEQARTFVIAASTGLIALLEEFGVKVAHFSTIGRVSAGSVDETVAKSHDWWEVLRGFEQRPHLARATTRQWEEVERILEQACRPSPDPVAALTDPQQLLRLLRLAANRQEAEMRDPKVIDLIRAWALLLRRIATLLHSELAEPGIDGVVRDWIGATKEAALARLRENGLRDETQRQLVRLLDRGLEVLPPTARP